MTYNVFGVTLNLAQLNSGMARVLKGSHSITCTPRVHPLTEWTIPAIPHSRLVNETRT